MVRITLRKLRVPGADSGGNATVINETQVFGTERGCDKIGMLLEIGMSALLALQSRVACSCV